ncbi:hypothetical protein OIN98_14995 [Staphylococcus aureus]|uniref:hypothetical protein n=1 Tax=Staphylococcus aureus TaxID=1280 RepID=UPI002AFE93FE|nr:hypothetical protein [Staphylococcus aureus]MEA1208094.1 hypothetical protein [Staphylococcus aureus]
MGLDFFTFFGSIDSREEGWATARVDLSEVKDDDGDEDGERDDNERSMREE